MALLGSTFKQVLLPGLDVERPSLLAATAPGGWLLQVTSAELRVLSLAPERALAHHTAAPGKSLNPQALPRNT